MQNRKCGLALCLEAELSHRLGAINEVRGRKHRGGLLPGGRWESAVRSVTDDWDEREEEERQSIVRDVGQGSVYAYIFPCQVCGELRGFWDCD